jgi:ATP adenylyltransferase
MAYVGGGAQESGCVFCNRAQSDDDRASLILHRGERCFVILNLYPYSTGHAMIVPYLHAADLEELPVETLHEMGELLPVCVANARHTLGCAGFNVGMNLGNVAGAGVADHLHEHIVPRWVGDANFMPILASTTVMPELLSATYAKLRTEFERERSDVIRLVVLDPTARRVLIDERNHRLPSAFLKDDEAGWRSGLAMLNEHGVQASVVDWAGAASTTRDAAPALLMQARSAESGSPFSWVEIAALASLPLSDADRAITERLHDPALVAD